MKDLSLSEILKPLANKDGLDIVNKLYIEGEILYDGIDFTIDNKNLVPKIEQLKESKIIDHDMFTETLSLEYQSDDFFHYLMEANTDTNIEDVKKKINLIKKEFENINKRKKNFEPITKEVKVIQKALRSIPSIIEKNSKALNNDTLFAYKVEHNIEIKISHLEDCKEQLSQLSKAIDSFAKFLKTNNKLLISILPAPALLDSIRKSLLIQRKTVINIWEATINYLSKTIDDGKFLKHLNAINELIKQNKIYKQTNIVEMAKNKGLIQNKVNIRKKIDYEIVAFDDELNKQYESANIPKTETPKKEYPPVDIESSKRNKSIKIVLARDLYLKFMQNEKNTDLATFLYETTKDNKKVNRFISSIVMKWHKNLTICDDVFVYIDRYRYPQIKRRF